MLRMILLTSIIPTGNYRRTRGTKVRIMSTRMVTSSAASTTVLAIPTENEIIIKIKNLRKNTV